MDYLLILAALLGFLAGVVAVIVSDVLFDR